MITRKQSANNEPYRPKMVFFFDDSIELIERYFIMCEECWYRCWHNDQYHHHPCGASGSQRIGSHFQTKWIPTSICTLFVFSSYLIISDFFDWNGAADKSSFRKNAFFRYFPHILDHFESFSLLFLSYVPFFPLKYRIKRQHRHCVAIKKKSVCFFRQISSSPQHEHIVYQFGFVKQNSQSLLCWLPYFWLEFYFL